MRETGERLGRVDRFLQLPWEPRHDPHHARRSWAIVWIDTRKQISYFSVMTENSDEKRYPSSVERFVLYWGDMGGSWGVNRSVAQIHALLYASERPLHADEIAERLGLARSNVSNSLKELLAWDLIHRVPVKGDRRDHFEAETDVVEMVRRIAAGKKERELDPAISALQRCVADAQKDPDIHPVALERLEAMRDLTLQVDAFYAQMFKVPKNKLLAIMRLGARLIDFLPLGGKQR